MAAIAIHIRDAGVDDLDVVVALENGIFTNPWSRQALRPELQGTSDRIALLADVDGDVVGYAIVWVVADELHLVTLGVLDEHRRKGIATRLLQAVLNHPRAAAANIMTLEVRPSNVDALEFYRREGFREVALRPRYYPDNKEDALVMLRDVGPPDRG